MRTAHHNSPIRKNAHVNRLQVHVGRFVLDAPPEYADTAAEYLEWRRLRRVLMGFLRISLTLSCDAGDSKAAVERRQSVSGCSTSVVDQKVKRLETVLRQFRGWYPPMKSVMQRVIDVQVRQQRQWLGSVHQPGCWREGLQALSSP